MNINNEITGSSDMEKVQILYDCRKTWERLNELDELERVRLKNFFIKSSDDRNILYIAEYFTKKKTTNKNEIVNNTGNASNASNTIVNSQLYKWSEDRINTTFEECLQNNQTLSIIKKFSKFKF
jgi:hypothetical protein